MLVPTSAARVPRGCPGRRFYAWVLARTLGQLPSAPQRLKSRLMSAAGGPALIVPTIWVAYACGLFMQGWAAFC
jgi:hypothetical protein